jgi:hypothetical protein
LWTAVNHADKTVALPVPESAEVLVGDRKLPPSAVLVWR